jgi:nucleoside phosphorylase
MSAHSLEDIAWKVNELMLSQEAQERFHSQCIAYLRRRRGNTQREPPKDLLALDCQLKLDEKYALLGALHDEVCTGEAKLGPRSDLDLYAVSREQAREAIIWAALRDTVRGWLRGDSPEDHRGHAQSWFKSVLADLQDSSRRPALTDTALLATSRERDKRARDRMAKQKREVRLRKQAEKEDEIYDAARKSLSREINLLVAEYNAPRDEQRPGVPQRHYAAVGQALIGFCRMLKKSQFAANLQDFDRPRLVQAFVSGTCSRELAQDSVDETIDLLNRGMQARQQKYIVSRVPKIQTAYWPVWNILRSDVLHFIIQGRYRAVGQAPSSQRLRSTPAVQAMTPRPDVVLVTVNEHETRAVHEEFEAASGAPATTVSLDGRVYRNLGTVNGTTVFHALSEMGSSSIGAMQQTVDKAIRSLDPGAVIAVGMAFGVNEKKQAIGDILVSKQLRPYDLQRVGSAITLRGDKPHSTPRLINHFEGFAHTTWQGPKVRPGVILTGEKLIDDIDYRDTLLALEEDAAGGEMEGAGLYVPCHEHKVDWIVIKAICDWADGQKSKNKTARQKKAARSAVQFLIQALQYAPLKRQK